MKIKQMFISYSLSVLVVFSALFVLTTPAYAQKYDCGTYGADAFGTAQSCDDSISNTGEPLKYLIPAFLVIGGVAILYRSSRKKPPEDKK